MGKREKDMERKRDGGFYSRVFILRVERRAQLEIDFFPRNNYM